MHVTVSAPAKVNLTLDVTGCRDDGYHLIDTIMQTIGLYDRVTAALTAEEGIRIQADDERLPSDTANTAYQAAQAFLAATDWHEGGVTIHLEKRIPQQAGLGGGSADAAGVLVALNVLTDARLETEALCTIGEAVGADVPFCVLGGAARCTGIGTILSPLPVLGEGAIVVVKPPCGVSTAEAYRLIDRAALERRPHTGSMADALCEGDLDAVGREVCNVFEEALALPEVAAIRRVLRAHRTLGCAMSGSGSAVFGIFREKSDAARCCQALRAQYEEVFLCEPVPDGPTVER